MLEINWTELILSFLGGFGLFLFGMEYMGEGLQKTAGSKMKNLLGALTRNRFKGVLVGAGVTAIVQSSSATTVMIVGFVNAGLMSLKQAVGVIMGANIGTTITAWIVSLGEWTEFLKPSTLAPACIIIGVILMMAGKNAKIKAVGQILFGFGGLFLGLDMMSSAAKPLSKLEEVKRVFLILGKNPILGILAGAVVTAIIQSSSASVGILQVLALEGLVPWSSAIYIILGQNIGTCITAILSSLNAGTNAKRAAFIHFLFNVIGSVIFMVIAIITFQFVVPVYQSIIIDVTNISIVHTTFNVLNTLILFPFAGVLVELAEKVIKEGTDTGDKKGSHLDERIIETPAFAIESAIKEVIKMGKLASLNVNRSIQGLFESDVEILKMVFETEREINLMQENINDFLIKLSNASLSEREQYTVTGLFNMVSDIERVGDHADNIGELGMNLYEQEVKLSEWAKEELIEISEVAMKSFDFAIDGYKLNDYDKMRVVLKLEKKVDILEEKLRETHIKRLVEEKCNAISGIIFLDTISNIERISDHASNIAMLILDKNDVMIGS